MFNYVHKIRYARSEGKVISLILGQKYDSDEKMQKCHLCKYNSDEMRADENLKSALIFSDKLFRINSRFRINYLFLIYFSFFLLYNFRVLSLFNFLFIGLVNIANVLSHVKSMSFFISLLFSSFFNVLITIFFRDSGTL